MFPGWGREQVRGPFVEMETQACGGALPPRAAGAGCRRACAGSSSRRRGRPWLWAAGSCPAGPGFGEQAAVRPALVSGSSPGFPLLREFLFVRCRAWLPLAALRFAAPGRSPRPASGVLKANTQLECRCQRQLFFSRRPEPLPVGFSRGFNLRSLQPAVRGAFQGEGQRPWPGWRARAPPCGFVLQAWCPRGLAFAERASGLHFWPPPRPAGRRPLRDISVSFLRGFNVWERDQVHCTNQGSPVGAGRPRGSRRLSASLRRAPPRPGPPGGLSTAVAGEACVSRVPSACFFSLSSERLSSHMQL